MELGSYFLFLQEQIKDIIIIKSLAPRMQRGLSAAGMEAVRALPSSKYDCANV
jgi:hypothetical protein